MNSPASTTPPKPRRTIHKYVLDLQGDWKIRAPEVFEPLSVQLQRGQICIWAIVDPQGEQRQHQFYVAGTGHPLRQDAAAQRFVGTVQQNDFVWHIFWLPGATDL